MKFWGIQIETKNMPWFAWLIISLSILLIAVGIMVALIKFGSVEFKSQEKRIIDNNERAIIEELQNENTAE